MHSFENDYSEGAHPSIINLLRESNWDQQTGYGQDKYSLLAKEMIQKLISSPDSPVYFTTGGTLANLMVIAALLRPHEAVISADTGHINEHEAGAVEAVGHKIISVHSEDGKLYPVQLGEVLKKYTMRPHVVKPRLVYISNSTELGTVYTRSELEALHEFCQDHGLLLYMDGARLAQGITSTKSDLKMSDLPKFTDAFTMGGTKNGALIGEAIVFKNGETMPDLDYILKQKGGMPAKGALIGIQFLELLKDDIYFRLGEYANEMAMKMAETIRTAGFEFLAAPESNQIFPILPDTLIARLREKYRFHDWKKIDERHTVVRLVTSWASPEAVVKEFIVDFKEAAAAVRD